MTQENIPVQPGTLDGERGLPTVNENGSGRTRKVLLFLFVVGFIVVLLLLLVFHMRGNAENNHHSDKTMVQTSTVPMRTFKLPPPPPPAPPEPPAPPPAPAMPIAEPAAAALSLPPLPDDTPAKDDVLDKSASALMVVTKSSGDTNAQTTNARIQALLDSQKNTKQDAGSLGTLLHGTQTDARMASLLRNRDFLLAKGSIINCALQTRLDSTVPGMAACVVTRNMYSDNGKVLLIERGSTISGEYDANVKQGMARIYVLWTRVKTPNGVVIDLDSPGADPLGGAGLPGYIDSHFWKRFGGALMLSTIETFGRYATQKVGGGGSNQINLNTGGGESTSNLASTALKDTINIPPTLYKNQGEEIGIYIARDLDFSSVYDVKPK
ncbi:type IV secretion system protein virB10 [Brucella ovis IntaBari-2006-46-332]|uniref:Type IV secretion system protein VirB10 n=1 Tax=Brucella ovis (strain ATCC 25840 / 63/290 / NCTC 10512) TaxID=444178 RepID=VRB10_BRUO2|nr:type IV secretion system protein VirB10 [Brucella ovis]Q0GK35.2 RecName: Full=Type IV secretion system protein virB10 [Brucella ovis ATCC 25840]ABQ61987.1 type IV secretion system protein VirB10 [Brucella ovis ATCC 25840]ENR05339.1 type IV secretion system protein virB10 [Brucella ovis F8/05B]ENS93946.1 type IV secretion system protein virB10 [Brucella ovis 63/96]ENS97873.1 type IV secretion system protein virB10 [Brucella ovis 81/8]ENT76345.1 type IV secretion system protein virB10 [Bruce